MSLRFRLIGLVCNCSQIKANLCAESTADLIRIAIQHGLADCDAGRP